MAVAGSLNEDYKGKSVPAGCDFSLLGKSEALSRKLPQSC